MGNPEEERTTINVKSVSVSAWERAKKAAAKQDEPMGVWLSRAAHHLADMEAGPREFPPSGNPEPKKGNPANPSMTAADVSELMKGMGALAAATGIKPAVRDVQRLYGLVDELVRAERGMAPRPIPKPPTPPTLIGKATGQSLLENG